MQKQIRLTQCWAALVLALFFLALGGHDVQAQKRKTPRKKPAKSIPTQGKGALIGQPLPNEILPQQNNSTSSDTESSATLQETVDWLKSAIFTFGRFRYLDVDRVYSDLRHYIPEQSDNCTLQYILVDNKDHEEGVYKLIVQPNNPNIPKITEIPLITNAAIYRDTITVPLNTLDPLSAKTSKHPQEFYVIELSTAGLKNTITKSRVFDYRYDSKGEFREPRENEKGPFTVDQNMASLSFKDEESANRIAKALKHAIKLCGGKVDPF